MERSAIGEDKALHYLYSGILPSRLANRLQTMKMCEAFGKKVKTTLYFCHALVTKEEIREYYNVEPTFDMEALGYSELPRLRSLFLVLKFLRLLRSRKSDGVIYVREIPLAFWLLTFRKLRFFKLPVILELHGWFDGELMRRIARYVVRNANKVVVITHFLRHEVSSFTCREKILVAPDGVDLTKFAISMSRDRARCEVGLPQDKTIIGYVGRFHTMGMRKGLDTMIKALRTLKEEGFDNVTLCFVGGPLEMVPFYLDLVKKERIGEGDLIFVNHVPPGRIPLYLRSFDICAMPFPWTEHFAYYASPLKLFEYMASKTPIVATDLPSTREILRDGENAILVEPDDPRALAEGVRKILDDPDLARRISEQAYSEVRQYNWEKRATRIIEFIKRD